MAQQTAAGPVAGLVDEPRMRPGTAVRLFAAIVLLVWLLMQSLLAPPAPRWALGAVVYVGLRAAGDMAEAVGGERTTGSFIEAVLKALSWGFVPLGVQWAFGEAATRAPAAPWVVGLMVLFFSVALASHYERARDRTPEAARLAAAVGLTSSVPGAALAATGLPLPAPWSIAAPVLVALAAIALALYAMPRHGEQGRRGAGWSAWWHHHRMRFLFLIVIIVGYVAARGFISHAVGADVMPIWEYLGAVAVAGFVLWSLRAHLDAVAQDASLVSPHRRHEPDVARWSEPELDAWEAAFGEFLQSGDTTEVRRLARRLEASDGVPAKRILEPLVSYRPPSGILLVHPFWPYLATLAGLLVLAVALARFAAGFEPVLGDLAHVFAPSALAVGLYAAQFNRYGGPWWLKTALGYLALVLVPFIEPRFAAAGIPGPLTLLLSPAGLLVLAALLLLPIVHAGRIEKSHRRAAFLYTGDDPGAAVAALTRRHERSLAVRAVWAAVLLVPAFLAAGELARLHEAFTSIVPLYLLFALIVLLHPLVLIAGLRMGREHVERIAAREAHERARRHEEAVAAIQAALAPGAA